VEDIRCFVLTGTPTSASYTLSLHDALPIWGRWLLPLGPGPAQALPPDEPGPSGRGRPRLAGSIQVWSQVLSGYLPALQAWHLGIDRKSTRLNSSHVKISYAVFCLKKKNKRQ